MTGEIVPSDDDSESDTPLVPADDSGELDSELVRRIAERFVELAQAQSSIQGFSQSYSGPLPPAAEFARYDEAVPGAGERIIELAENSSRRSLEAQLDDNRLGRHVTWSIVILGIALFGAQVLIARDLIAEGSVELGSVAAIASAIFIGLGVLVNWWRGRKKDGDSEE